MRIAVVGANGFLGKFVVRNLTSEDKEVICVYNQQTDNIPTNLEKISMKDFLKGKEEVESIIFSAGSFRNSLAENNRLNCVDLYTLTKNYSHCRFLYISSANVYGNTSKEISESSPFYEPNQYGMSKLSGETIVSGMEDFAIVRLVYIYGQGLDNGSFLPFLVKSAKENQRIGLFGGGKREQDYLHVKDASDLCVKALLNGKNQTYLGATGTSISNLEIATKICDNIKTGCEVEFSDQPEKNISFYYDPSWTCEELNWKPKVTIDEGIKKMLE